MPELHEKQRYAIDYITKSFQTGKQKGFILADKMGLGKTAPAIELCKRADKALIICPAFLLYNWIDELKKWGIVDTDMCVIDARDQIIEDKKIYLVAYSRIAFEKIVSPNGVVKKQPNGIIRQLLKKQFDLIVCDEGHYLKGWNSQRSRFILGTFQNKNNACITRTKNILLLSGTPFLNRIEEVYNIVIRIAPNILDYMTKYQFYQMYAGWIENTGFEIVAHGVKNEEDLRRRLAPIMLRRTEIENLKELVEETIRLDPRSPKLRKLFDEEEKFLRSHGIRVDDIDSITRIKKADASQIAGVRTQIALCKIPAMLELIEDIREAQEESAPITIFCYHRGVLAALKEAVTKKYPKLKSAFIDGGTGTKERHEIIKNKFQVGKLDILCATIGALREGVNATAGRDVIFIELDYVPANIAQAIGRFHRRGQTGTVYVRKLVFDAGIEKRILKILEEKKITIEKIMGE